MSKARSGTQERGKSYDQFCGLAKALDVVGERWTLLIIRELMLGPRRYTDVAEGLPGISSAVLSQRLGRLEATGLIAKSKLPPPAGVFVYELTEGGRDLAEAMVPLAVWGVRLLKDGRRHEAFRPGWPFLYLRETLNKRALEGVDDVFEFHIDDHTVTVHIHDGAMDVTEAPSPVSPDVVVRTDANTFIDLGLGGLPAKDAIAQGSLVLEGSPDAIRRYVKVFGVAREQIAEHSRKSTRPRPRRSVKR